MLMAPSDAFIASRHSSFTPFYWGVVRFLFTAYDADSLESIHSVQIVRTYDRQRIDIWRPKKNSIRMTIHNTSSKRMAFLVRQEFSDARGYELEEKVDLIAGDMIKFREFGENSTLSINVINHAKHGAGVHSDDDFLFFSVRSGYFIVWDLEISDGIRLFYYMHSYEVVCLESESTRCCPRLKTRLYSIKRPCTYVTPYQISESCLYACAFL